MGALFQLLFHGEGLAEFRPEWGRENLRVLLSLLPEEELESDGEGRLKRVSGGAKRWLFWKDLLLWGSYSHRTQKALFFTLLLATYEEENPLDGELLSQFIERKEAFLQRLAKRYERRLGVRHCALVKHAIELFYRTSWVQRRLISRMEEAVYRQGRSPLVQEAEEELKRGISPRLVTVGASGAYWMRRSTGSKIAIFKPFDEELFAPNNPLGGFRRGVLGQRHLRRGIRVGEGAHREVAAYLVDQFFSFGIVPQTCYASFTHRIFFVTREDWFHRVPKRKMGSFQEYAEGVISLEHLPMERWEEMTLEQFQKLVLLDVIVGNMDRNTGNILLGEGRMVAVDHALSFGDQHEKLSFWYWRYFSHSKRPFVPSLVALLQDFPTKGLIEFLGEGAHLEPPCLARMRERVALFREGVLQGLTPHALWPLMRVDLLLQLSDYQETLPARAKEIVEQARLK